MADLNQKEQELAEVLGRVSEDIRRYGKVTQDTMDAVAAGSTEGAQRLKSAKLLATDALMAVGSAGMASAKAMYEGKKGASALNGALDGLAQAATLAGTALSLLIPGGPLIKAVVAGLTMAAGAAIKLTQAQNEMADKLYKGYAGLAKSGAAAADGMSGLFEDAKKLGLAMDELDSYISVVAANSKDLALFGGTVFEGRKKLADMGKALEGNREEFLRMGLSMEDVTAGMAGYIRLQSRVGETQNKTVGELAEGARKYLLEQDALTKLTGLTRQEQEAAREAVRSQERFRGKLLELEMQGKHKEAKELEATYLMLYSQNKEAAQGFADISTNMVGTEAAQKSMMASQGESMRVAQQISANQMDAVTGAQRIARAHGATADALGTTLGQMGTYNQTMGNLEGDINLKRLAESDLRAQYNKVIEDQTKVTQGQGDKALNLQAELRAKQIKANEATERFVRDGMEKATGQMIKLTEATAAAANGLNKLFGAPAQKEVEVQRKEAQAKEDKASAAAAAAAAAPQDKATQDAARQAELEAQRSGDSARQAEAARRKKQRDEARAARQKTTEPVAPAPAEAPATPAPAAPEPAAATGRAAPRRAPPAAPAPASAAPTPAPAPAAPEPAAATGRAAPRRAAPTAAPAAPAAPAAAAPAAPAAAPTSAPTAAPTAAPTNVRIGPAADMTGVDQRLLTAFNSFAAEFGQPISVNSAFRDDEKQAELWVRANVYKDPSVKMPAKPKRAMTITYNGQEHQVPGGKGSKHNLGAALDISAAGMGDTKGPVDDLLAKFGLHRPHLPKDPPHIQLMAEGGITDGPAIAGEAGPEAVIPLRNQNVPVQISADSTVGQTLVSLDQTMRDLLSANRESLILLQEIRRANETAATASTKIARAALN